VPSNEDLRDAFGCEPGFHSAEDRVGGALECVLEAGVDFDACCYSGVLSLWQ